MKITVENDDYNVIIEDKTFDGTMDGLQSMFRGISACLGYHPETINEYLPEVE